MKNLLLILVVTLLCGTAVSHAEDPERLRAPIAQADGMRRGEDGNRAERGRDHDRDRDRDRGRRNVIVVGVPIFVGPGYVPYYAMPSTDPYETIDGFWYYCPAPAGYYPDVSECASGWRLVPSV
jgi:hypothetical protein